MALKKLKHRIWDNSPTPETCCVCGAPRNAYVFFDNQAGYLHNYHGYCDAHLPREKMGPGIPPPCLLIMDSDLRRIRKYEREAEISWGDKQAEPSPHQSKGGDPSSL